MPTYIIKPRRDEDFYIRYSTIVDSPTAWGTKSELTATLRYDEAKAERFDRADLNGTSALADWPEGSGKYQYGWHEDTFIIREGFGDRDAPAGAIWLEVSRAQLREFCERTGNAPTWVTEPLIGAWRFDDEGAANA